MEAMESSENDHSADSAEEEQSQELITDGQSNTDGSSRRKRGVTRGLSVQKKRGWTRKLDIVIHPTRNRIVGENAKDFKTESCVTIKQYSPVEHARWRDIPENTKTRMWLSMKLKFNLEENDHVKKIVFDQLNRQFRSYRHKLHNHYLKNKDDSEILDHPPTGVNGADWSVLVDYFKSDAFKKVSDRNKKNRQNLKMSHSCGTKSIAQSCYEERNFETGEEPTRTMAWRMSRFSSKKKDWIDEASKKVYEELLMLQTEPVENGDSPMTEEEAFVKVLGEEKSSRLRGCGDGLKPPSKRGERINYHLQRENEELRNKNEELSSRFEALETQVSTQEVNLQAQLQSLLQAQLPAILQNLNSTGQLSNSG